MRSKVGASDGPAQVRVLDALHDIALAAGEASQAATITALVARHARALLHADEVVLCVWDPDANVLRLAFGQDTVHAPRPRIRAGEGAIGQAFTACEPVVVRDYLRWKGALPEVIASRVKRVAAVPLKVDAQVHGVLAVRFLGERGCTPNHVRVLQLLATPLGVILDAAHARQRAETDEARLAAVVEHLPSGVLVRSAEGELVLMNATARGTASAQRIAPDQIEQFEVYESGTQRRLAPSDMPTARASAGEHVISQELRVKLPNSDQDAWIRISAVPVRSADEAMHGSVAIFTDVSRERQLMRSLHSSARANTRLMAELHQARQREAELSAPTHRAEPPRAPTDTVKGGLSARSRSPRADRARPDQPPDRTRPGAESRHDQKTRRAHPAQARRCRSHACRGARGRDRPGPFARNASVTGVYAARRIRRPR